MHFADRLQLPFDKCLQDRQNIAPRNKRTTRGDVAQLGEHHVRNVGVVGSNPIISTTETRSGRGQRLRPDFSVMGGESLGNVV